MTDSFFNVESAEATFNSFDDTPFNIVTETFSLTVDSISSPNYVLGDAGWKISKSGDAEFNDVTVRGSFAAGNIDISDDFIVLQDGEFGAGNVKVENILGVPTIVPRLIGDPGYVEGGGFIIWNGVSLTVSGDAVLGGASIVDGSITSAKISNNTILDEDVNSSANIQQSKILNLTSDLSSKAPLNSPTFTGTPNAPTAVNGTNTTQIATTAFVRTEVSNLIDSAPTTLDTLNELAAALGDDPNFATTVTDSLSLKAPLASPTFTGTVTLPSNTITGSMILNDAVDSDKLKDSATVDSDRSVTTNHVRNGAVTNDKIADGTINETKLNTALQTKLSDYETRISALEDLLSTTTAGTDIVIGHVHI
jgi:hypothetical protein